MQPRWRSSSRIRGRADEGGLTMNERYGINAHLPENRLEIIDRCAELGVGWVRLDFDWWRIESQRGQFQWDHCDRVVGRALERGLQIMATLSYPPEWANGKGADSRYWPANDVNDWRNFVDKTVRRFSGRIRHWGMGNEPNHPHYFQAPVPDYTTKILIPGSEAAKAADPNCLVLGPDLADRLRAVPQVLGQILLKAGRHIDIVTHHIYKDAGTWWKRIELHYRLSILRKTLATSGRLGKAFWITEMGWQATDGASCHNQAKQYKAFLGLVRRRRFVDKVFFYDTIDWPHPPHPMHFGLLREDLSLKPAFGVCRDWMA